MSASNWIYLDDVTILKETEKALHVELDDGTRHWIPFSQIADQTDYQGREGETGVSISISEWIAGEKNIG